jgi:hypothetical protein
MHVMTGLIMSDDSIRFYQEWQQQFEQQLLEIEAIAELKAKLLSNRQDMEREMKDERSIRKTNTPF